MSFVDPHVIFDVKCPIIPYNLEGIYDDDEVYVPDSVLVCQSSSENTPFDFEDSFRINFIIPGIGTGIPFLPLIRSMDDIGLAFRKEYKWITSQEPMGWIDIPHPYVVIPLPYQPDDEDIPGKKTRLQLSTLKPIYDPVKYPRGFRFQPVSFSPDWSIVIAQAIMLEPGTTPDE